MTLKKFFKFWNHRHLLWLLSAGFGVFTALTTFLVWQFYHQQEVAQLEDLKKNQEYVAAAAQEISDDFLGLEPAARSVAQDLGNGTLKKAEAALRARLEQDVSQYPDIYQLGISFEPFVWSSKEKGYAIFSSLTDDARAIKVLDYDYTEFQYEWYRRPLLYGALWVEPYYGKGAQTFLAEFGVPFWLPSSNPEKDSPSGVISVNYSLDTVKRKVRGLYLPNQSYTTIISREGRFLAHPEEKLVFNGTTIFEEAWQKNALGLHQVGIEALRGHSGHIRYHDPVTDREMWMILETIPSTGWTLAVAYDDHSLGFRPGILRQVFVIIILALVSLVLFGFLLITAFFPAASRGWAVSMITTVLISLAVAATWWAAQHYYVFDQGDSIPLYDEAAVLNYTHRYHQQARQMYIDEPITIPTGVFIQSMEFQSAYNIWVKGYIWQHYLKDKHQGIRRGIILPEAEQLDLQETYRYIAPQDRQTPGCQTQDIAQRDCSEVVGWYFSAVLRQNFDYARYPFDRHHIGLRLWPQDFHRHIILTPDLPAYQVIQPAALGAMEKDFVFPGWKLKSNYFEYRPTAYNTTFGSESSSTQLKRPELYLMVHIQRLFLSVFVSRIIPVLVVIGLVFLILLGLSRNEEVYKWTALAAKDAILGVGSLFFVLIIQHSFLREQLNTSQVIYFEYFFFISYVFLLLVSVNYLMSAWGQRWILYKDNFIPKIFYWPVFMLSLLVVTFVTFY